MPYCTRCGTAQADDAAFCPWCGAPVAPGVNAPIGAAEPDRRISSVIGESLARYVGRPGLVVFGIAAVCTVAWLAAAAIVVLGGAWMMFGTVHPHSIIDTGCFVRHDNPASPNGAPSYTLIKGCEVFRIHPNPATVVFTLLVGALLIAVLGALIYIIVARATDRRFGSRHPWPLMPSAGSVLRVVMRVIGWGIVLYVAFVAAFVAVFFAFVILASIGHAVGVLLGIAGCAYLLVWWAVPLAVRVSLAFVRMVIDDRGFVQSWNEVRPSMGQAWAFVGLNVAISFGLSIAGFILQQAGTVGLVLNQPLQVVSYTVQLVLLVAVMRFLAGELAPDDGAATV